MIFYVIVYLMSVFVASISQIILKKSAAKKYKNIIYEYLNVRVVVAYSMFVVSTFLTMYAYKVVPLTLGTLLEAVGYIYIPILSYIFLKEKITKSRVIGSVIIIIGILVFVM